jgi:uncharacterized RmlC-like cupin family protein
MTNSDSERPDTAPASSEAAARIIKPLQFDGNTPQTSGMQRLAAVSQLLVGSEKLWAGVMLAEPNTTSSVHHHGPQETVVYVAEGRGTLRWGRRLEHQTDLEAGDFLFIPPYVPHQEINPSADQPALWIVVRSGAESVVVDLALGAEGEYVGTARQGQSTPRSRVSRQQLISLTLLAVSALAVVAGAVVGARWLRHAEPGWDVLLSTGTLALIGVLDIVWALHLRGARRLAVLDAYAEKEIARSRHDQDRKPLGAQQARKGYRFRTTDDHWYAPSRIGEVQGEVSWAR